MRNKIKNIFIKNVPRHHCDNGAVMEERRGSYPVSRPASAGKRNYPFRGSLSPTLSFYLLFIFGYFHLFSEEKQRDFSEERPCFSFVDPRVY